MWRRTYLLLLLVRIYFAACPSYLHPDENFQGPEVIAGHIFSYPSHRTWEWTSPQPVRSVFPLWLSYGMPMTLLKWVWVGDEPGSVAPAAIYYTLRVVMFMLSFVLEDWAIHELVHSPRHRHQAMVLVASSYVTWTFQTHTFSNSIETLLVSWSLVLVERILSEKKRSSWRTAIFLGFLLVLGTFNRITFPAFLVIPGMQLLPHFWNRPVCFLAISLSGLCTVCLAIATDTAFYSGPEATASFRALFHHLYHGAVFTPLNNLRYNSSISNLESHGLHPHYQHFLVNLPQLLGPALILLLNSLWPLNLPKLKAILANPRLTSAATGVIILSLIPHQEPRFLLPCIPLLLTCIRLPSTYQSRRTFWISWAIFNSVLAVLMGIYHQGGVIPTQIAIPSLLTAHNTSATQSQVFWWKTYPPPTYLIGLPDPHPSTGVPLNITTTALMGTTQSNLLTTLSQSMSPCTPSHWNLLTAKSVHKEIYLAAPLSAIRFNSLSPISPRHLSFLHEDPSSSLNFTHLTTYKQHLNLDDMDWSEDGVWGTLVRVIGRRGLGVWHVGRICPPQPPPLPPTHVQS